MWSPSWKPMQALTNEACRSPALAGRSLPPEADKPATGTAGKPGEGESNQKVVKRDWKAEAG